MGVNVYDGMSDDDMEKINYLARHKYDMEQAVQKYAIINGTENLSPEDAYQNYSQIKWK